MGKVHDKIEKDIATAPYHVSLIGVFDARPSFVYTIGLQDLGWPELIIAGLDIRVGGVLLNDIVLRCRERGDAPRDGEEFVGIANYALRCSEVSDVIVREYLCAAYRRANDLGLPVNALQVLMPDPVGLFDERYIAMTQDLCPHTWQEVDTDEDNTGVPPYDVCNNCGQRRD